MYPQTLEPAFPCSSAALSSCPPGNLLRSTKIRAPEKVKIEKERRSKCPHKVQGQSDFSGKRDISSGTQAAKVQEGSQAYVLGLPAPQPPLFGDMGKTRPHPLSDLPSPPCPQHKRGTLTIEEERAGSGRHMDKGRLEEAGMWSEKYKHQLSCYKAGWVPVLKTASVD